MAVWVLLAMIVVGLSLAAGVSIKNGPQSYGYFFVDGEHRKLRQVKPDTTRARAKRAMAAWPYLIVIGTAALIACGYVAVLAGLVVIAIVALLIAVFAGAGLMRAEWLAAHAERWHLDD